MVSQCALLQAKKRPGDGKETLESSEQNYVDVSKYSPPDINKYTSHEMEEMLLSKVRPFQFSHLTARYFPVLQIQIRIHRIHMFLGLLDPDPDPFITEQK